MALELSSDINGLTKNFPKDELFILTSQIKRAADSVSLNIAEGSTGQTTPEFKRFLGIALRSAVEVIGCLHIAINRKIITQSEFDVHYDKTVDIIKSIQALRNALK